MEVVGKSRTDATTSQPDVFETEDVPDEPPKENAQYISEAANENIEKDKLSPDEAFKKFAAASLDSSTIDYSDKIVKKRLRKGGFGAHKSDFEINASDASKEETPLQRFHRLQYEVKQFLQEVQQLQPQKSSTASEGELNAANIAEELALLQTQLQSLLREEKLQPVLNPKYEIQQAAIVQQGLTKKLQDELHAVSQKPTQQNDDASKASCVTYELYYTPDQSKFLHASKVADLERRLTSIEQLIGNVAAKQLSVPGSNLVATVEQLQERLAVLKSPAQLEALQRKAKTVTQDLDALLDKKKQANEAPTNANEAKIVELFELMHKWDSVAQQLPAIVSRLQALRSLHEASAALHDTVQQLDTQQEALKKVLKSNSELLAQVDTNFRTNMTVIQSNVTALEQRFAEVAKRIK